MLFRRACFSCTTFREFYPLAFFRCLSLFSVTLLEFPTEPFIHSTGVPYSHHYWLCICASNVQEFTCRYNRQPIFITCASLLTLLISAVWLPFTFRKCRWILMDAIYSTARCIKSKTSILVRIARHKNSDNFLFEKFRQ